MQSSGNQMVYKKITVFAIYNHNTFKHFTSNQEFIDYIYQISK